MAGEVEVREPFVALALAVLGLGLVDVVEWERLHRYRRPLTDGAR